MPHYLWHHMHCIHVITPTISNTASTVSVSSQPLRMISEQLCVWQHTHFIYDTLCTIYNVTSTLSVHTIVVTTLHALHSLHHTHYIRYHTHDNTKVISAISPSITDSTSSVSVSSNPVYQLYYTHSLYDIKHYMHDITFSMHDITWTLYDITPIIFYVISMLFLSPNPLYWWYHTNSIYEISSSIYVDIISIVYKNLFTIFVPSQPLYLCLKHALSMISHSLYIWHCMHYMFNIWYSI